MLLMDNQSNAWVTRHHQKVKTGFEPVKPKHLLYRAELSSARKERDSNPRQDVLGDRDAFESQHIEI